MWVYAVRLFCKRMTGWMQKTTSVLQETKQKMFDTVPVLLETTRKKRSSSSFLLYSLIYFSSLSLGIRPLWVSFFSGFTWKLLIWKKTFQIAEQWEWSTGPTLHTSHAEKKTHWSRNWGPTSCLDHLPEQLELSLSQLASSATTASL